MSFWLGSFLTPVPFVVRDNDVGDVFLSECDLPPLIRSAA
jgi:hypothetical protein